MTDSCWHQPLFAEILVALTGAAYDGIMSSQCVERRWAFTGTQQCCSCQLWLAALTRLHSCVSLLARPIMALMNIDNGTRHRHGSLHCLHPHCGSAASLRPVIACRSLSLPAPALLPLLLSCLSASSPFLPCCRFQNMWKRGGLLSLAANSLTS
jgi:hypothetical protein